MTRTQHAPGGCRDALLWLGLAVAFTAAAIGLVTFLIALYWETL